MNNRSTDRNREEDLAQKLNQAAEQTRVNPQFEAELERKLREAHQPKSSWFAFSLRQISPALRWAVLMILLGLVLSLSIATLIPARQPAAHGTPVKQGSDGTPAPIPDNNKNKTPAPSGKSYDYNGAKLILSAELPSLPKQTTMYTLLDTPPATVEDARTLANQFGIDGEIYAAEGHSQDTPAFMVTDGKQQLIVYANNDYTYISDIVKHSRNPNGFPNENAETIIREYLKAHDLDFNFRFRSDGTSNYFLDQLSPEDMPLQSAYSGNAYMSITLDEEGNILSLTSMLMNYDATSLGEYRIISAEDALNHLLDPDLPAGKIEGGSSPLSPYTDYTPPTYWYHDYPNDQTVTTYGQVIFNQAVDTTKPAAIFIDNVLAIGNTDGVDQSNEFAYVQATGQFIVENGVRKFKVDTWKLTPVVDVMGSAHREGDQIIIKDGSGASYILTDPPADLPLDTESPEGIYFTGAAIDGKYYWTSIQYVKDINSMGGGGGGGGNGFYKLNLSGTAVPFPTAIVPQHKYTRAELASFLRYTVQDGDTLAKITVTYHVPVEDLMVVNNLTDSTIATGWQLTIPGVPGPTRLDGDPGIVWFQIYDKPDGRQRVQYMFSSDNDQVMYEVHGDNLESLQRVAYLPIKIWGNLSFDEMGNILLDLEKFEVIYPDLQPQTLTGTQASKEVNGEQLVLFTTGGTTYVKLDSSGHYPDSNYSGGSGEVNLQALQVPGETYAGYPALRVALDAAAMKESLPDPYGNGDSYIRPDITIEKVELIYLVYNTSQPGSVQPKQYLQPVWHFWGRTTDGGETDILIQALDQEYLLPETQQ